MYLKDFSELDNFQRSNAAQMRKYRARQRSDPLKYQQYLERERIRNFKRKYEKRIQEAQERAQAMGVPYIVVSPNRRGRKLKFGCDVSLVLPAKYHDDTEEETNSYNSDEMLMMPVKVELQESNEICQEQKPIISVVNINKLLNHPRTALQTLLPQEVDERQRVSNFIKSEHDYVKQKTDASDKFPIEDGTVTKRSGRNTHPDDKHELMRLPQQCRNFILNKAIMGSVTKPKRRRRQPNKMPAIESSSNFVRSDCVEHEDLEDLFRELAEVANKEPPKKKHSSPRKHSPRKPPFFNQTQANDDGKFSLTVSMPVQPIVTSQFTGPYIKKEPMGPLNLGCETNYLESKSVSILNDNLQTLKKSVNNRGDFHICNEDSIEIKQEPTSDDD